MKHISIFLTNADYENKKNLLSLPLIAYVQDDDVIYCTNTSTNTTNGNTTNISSYIDNPGEINYENFDDLLD